MNVCILVHGGAGGTVPEAASPLPADDPTGDPVDGCQAAARAGHAVMRAGGSAVDAVVAAVQLLEDDPRFNAGTGSVLNADGEVEMDAALMDGDRGRAGAVALVRTVKNPILLARLVMERTAHVLLAGEGADLFAREQGIPAVPPAALITAAARASWQRATESKHGTVGAVAFDGVHVAAATSTGGTAQKRRGRIGDSPLIGCGTYAWDGGGAVSCTGLGEAIMRAVLAKSAVDRLQAGDEPAAAARQAIALLEQAGGDGGLIMVDSRGRLGWAFNTPRMPHAGIDVTGKSGAGAVA